MPAIWIVRSTLRGPKLDRGRCKPLAEGLPGTARRCGVTANRDRVCSSERGAEGAARSTADPLVWYENLTMGRPKQAQVKEVFHVRLLDERRRALQAEAETRGSTPSDVIRLHLERYAEIAWRDLPKLGDHE